MQDGPPRDKRPLAPIWLEAALTGCIGVAVACVGYAIWHRDEIPASENWPAWGVAVVFVLTFEALRHFGHRRGYRSLIWYIKRPKR